MWRSARRLSGDDEKALGELWQSARRMEGRIDALEKVLDAEAPGWRMRQEAEPMAWTNSTQRFRLWRDRDRGIIAGVCAGIADYIGVEPIVVRLIAVPASSSSSCRRSSAYVVLALVLRPKPPALYASPRRGGVLARRQHRARRHLSSLKHKFRDLEERLGQMESQVASGDFELHRKFRDLGR